MLAAGADILNVQLDTPLSAELIDLGDKGHIHHITGLDGGALRGHTEPNGVEGVIALSQPQPGMPTVAHQADAVDG